MRVDAKNISFAYNDRKILRDVNLSVSDGEFAGIIGPNGSGKSTLLKCMCRIFEPAEGTVYVGGKPLKQMSFKESARKVSVVSQHNYYNFDFSVRDVVLMGRSPHKKAMERDNAQDYRIVTDALKKVGMESMQARIFSTLSGGEQQRVILARALAQKTECLLLDEPTNHLDIKYQLELMDIVKHLGKTVIAAIHDLNIAAMYCDVIHVLKDGNIIDSGTPSEILTPELIKQVYDVDAEVFQDIKGITRIIYFGRK